MKSPQRKMLTRKPYQVKAQSRASNHNLMPYRPTANLSRRFTDTDPVPDYQTVVVCFPEPYFLSNPEHQIFSTYKINLYLKNNNTIHTEHKPEPKDAASSRSNWSSTLRRLSKPKTRDQNAPDATTTDGHTSLPVRRVEHRVEHIVEHMITSRTTLWSLLSCSSLRLLVLRFPFPP